MISPIFVPTPRGKLYASVFLPKNKLATKGWVLHIPAFAEEMNKARPMVSKQARALADAGYAVVVPDLFGTGDSGGDLGEVDWKWWRADIASLLDWIAAQGGSKVCLWGLRTGCLLALDVARSNSEQIGALVLWQPVPSGQIFINQFLRLRVAASLFANNKETVSSLRARLETGENLEIAGYSLNAGLVEQMEAVTAEALAPPPEIQVCWVEVKSSEDKSLTPVSRRVLDAWADHNVNVEHQLVTGPPFWTTQEISLAPELLQFTNQYFASTPISAPTEAVIPQFAQTSGELTNEIPLVFDCEGKELVGLLHKSSSSSKLGVLVVVGGPQYRVGSHRQFVHLARDLADAGIPVFRFDYRGMGDSDGKLAGFEFINDDIASAIDAMQTSDPTVERIVIWGLCDAASAACFYAANDKRVAGLVILNPWVHSEQGEAKTYLKYYYIGRLTSKAFWKKILSGGFDIAASLKSLKQNLQSALGSKIADESIEGIANEPSRQTLTLTQRIYQGLTQFKGPILLILSGEDLTAREFVDSARGDRKFNKLLSSTRVTRKELTGADHTFSSDSWRNQVSMWTAEWVKSL